MARETRKLAKLARADDAAKAHQARRTANRDATALAVADQDLTIADLLEGIGLLDEFAWQPPPQQSQGHQIPGAAAAGARLAATRRAGP